MCGTSRATAYRVLARYREAGWEALRDRPPIARSHPARLSREAEQQIIELRGATGWGPKRLAGVLGWPAATIWRVLRRHGISRRARTAPPPTAKQRPPNVYLDIKQLGRFWQVGKRALGDGVGRRNRQAGWSYLHLAVDDHSRYAVAQLRPTQTSSDAVAFLEHALESSRAQHQDATNHSDNGSCYVGKDLRRVKHGYGTCARATRLAQTEGKPIGLLKWAYGYIWHSSAHRARALPGYLRWYNTHRAHGTTAHHHRISQAQVLTPVGLRQLRASAVSRSASGAATAKRTPGSSGSGGRPLPGTRSGSAPSLSGTSST